MHISGGIIIVPTLKNYIMSKKKDENTFQKAQHGSGSSESQGESRDAQKAKVEVSEEEKKDIADQTGLQPGDITDIKDLGGLSGRDDLSGGSGDDMTSTSSNEPTETY